jgi:hypothetical protein
MEVEEPELPEALAMRNSVDVVGDLNGLFSNFQVPLSISAIDFNNLFAFRRQQPSRAAPLPVLQTQAWSFALNTSAVPDLSINAAAIQPGQMPRSLLSGSMDVSMWDRATVDQAQPGISTNSNAGAGTGSEFDANALALGVDPFLPDQFANIAHAATATIPLVTWDRSMVDQAQPGISTNSNAGTGAGSGFDVNALALGVDPLLPDHFANIAPAATVTAPVTTSRHHPTTASVAVDEVFSPASNLSTLQLDEKGISQSAQDYL